MAVIFVFNAMKYLRSVDWISDKISRDSIKLLNKTNFIVKIVTIFFMNVAKTVVACNVIYGKI